MVTWQCSSNNYNYLLRTNCVIKSQVNQSLSNEINLVTFFVSVVKRLLASKIPVPCLHLNFISRLIILNYQKANENIHSVDVVVNVLTYC